MQAQFAFEEASIGDMQRALQSGTVTSRELVQAYLERIDRLDRQGPQLRSVIETNPEAETVATVLDRERQEGRVRGPLHGIPILLKDNIDTADAMGTTAGSLALAGSRPREDAEVARRLRAAGAIFLGKANMSEWANFRSTHSSSGWSARGGQCRNPYALDRSPIGSSSGSAAATAANLCAAAVGTETDGSIVSPGAACSVVGIKPTVGLVSRSGIIPISASQDTAGPMCRSVADAALLLGIMAGRDQRDRATDAAPASVPDFSQALFPDGLRGARIGVARECYFGYSEKSDRVADAAIETMRQLGATIVDPANVPSASEMRTNNLERLVLLYEFKAGLNAYLGSVDGAHVHALQDIIDFNEQHAAEEMPYFGQETLVAAQEVGSLEAQEYREARARNLALAGAEGIDRVMDEFKLDALVAPTCAPPWKIDLIDGDNMLGGSAQPAAVAGYPAITVPAGYVFDLPVGLTFFGRAWSEATLFRLAYAFEQATRVRKAPAFRQSV